MDNIRHSHSWISYFNACMWKIFTLSLYFNYSGSSSQNHKYFQYIAFLFRKTFIDKAEITIIYAFVH